MVKQIILIGFLIFIPISIAAHFWEWGELVIFITAGLAILPLAGWMGTATEEIAVVLGPSWGGLLKRHLWQRDRINHRPGRLERRISECG